jgi:ribosome biogenesis protein ENP2
VLCIILVHRRCNYCFLCFRLYEVKDERHAEAFLESTSLAHEDAVPIEDRIAALERQQSSKALEKVKYGPGGSREISFISGSRRKHKEESPSDDEGPNDFKRRGVQSLGLKQGKAEFYMFGGNRGRGRGGARGRGGRGRGGRGGRGRG